MNLTDELDRLARLREAGELSDQEFSVAKRKLLVADAPPSPPLVTRNEERGIEPAAPVESRTYRSSRWSSGNRLFPDSLTLASDGILFRKNRLFGSSEEHINYRAVASFRVTNGVFLADISIETSGGSQPIFVNGLWKSAAREIQETLRGLQP